MKMGIQIIHILIYVVLVLMILYCFCYKSKSRNRWVLYVQNHLGIIIFLLAFNTISFGISMKGTDDEYYIERQSASGQEKEYSFEAEIEGQDIPFKLQVPPKKLKPKEAEEKMEEAFIYLDDNLKGENISLNKVNKNLDISIDHEMFPFDIEVRPEDYSLMDEDGVLRNDRAQLMAAGYTENEIMAGIDSRIAISLSYGELYKEKTYEVTVFPKEISETEKIISEIEKLYARKEQESVYESGFLIPADYKNIHIVSLSGKRVSPEWVLIIGFLVAGLLIMREAEAKKSAEGRRKHELLRAYPWFINEMVLLLGAGMQVRNVFSLLVEEYDKKDYRESLINELQHSKHDFEIGMAEGRVYYELGRRLKLPCYIKILTLLEQNVTKGSKGLVEILEQEERNALEERMNLAKKSGEEAGTKLLGPMILLLIIVMLMIMIPAFLSFA